jgi:serine/threonine protein kinase
LRCLEKNPAARPQSAMELAALLAACPRAAESTPEKRNDWWTQYHARKTAPVAEPDKATSEDHIPEVRINLESHSVTPDGENGRPH